MKKFFPLFIFVFASIYTNAQTITQTQTTLISKKSADWCTFCGTYGWSFTEKLLKEAAGLDLIFWSVHHSGGLATPTSKALADNFGGVGQPVFFLNTDTEDLQVTGSNVDAKALETAGYISDLSALGASVYMGTEAKLKGKALTTKTKVKFPEDVESGEYYVGTYIVKKNLVWTQTSVGPNAVHHSVLDKSLSTDYFGTKIAKAPIATNTEFATTATLDELILHNNKLEDTKIVTVLWNKIASGKFIFINARETSIVLDNTSGTADNTIDALDFETIIAPQHIQLTVNGNVSNPLITMYDASGKEVIFTISKSGTNTFQLENIQTCSGSYFIQVTADNKRKTKQVFLMN
jgi:hypothetical protein